MAARGRSSSHSGQHTLPCLHPRWMTTGNGRRPKLVTEGHTAGVGKERMTNQSVVLAVATYTARADADHDFDSARLVGQKGRLDHVGAAVVEKGADGKLEIRRHDSTAEHLVFPDALLDGAITVIAPPLGIALLAPVLPTREAWASSRRDRRPLLAPHPQGHPAQAERHARVRPGSRSSSWP